MNPKAVLSALFSLTLALFVSLPATAGNGAAGNYCQSAPNSVGTGATMDYSGSLDPTQNDLVLVVNGVPSTVGLFFMGDTQTFVSPFFDGSLCISMGPGSQNYRLFPPRRIVGNTMTRSVDNTVGPPQLLIPGSTWNFQFIYRDQAAGGTGVNLSDGLEITFASANTAPVADAGPDQTVQLGGTVQLDGSGSTDVDMDMLSFSWTFMNLPVGSSAVLSDPTAVMPTFVADVAGDFVLRLIANDGALDSARDTVTITTQPGNTAPVANAGADQVVTAGDTVQLDGSASTDVDMDPLTYAWALTSAPLGSGATISNPSAVMPMFVADLPGNYVAELVVNDGTVDSQPDTVFVTTNPANGAPTADAGADQTVNLGDVVQLDGSASTDPEMDILSYAWSLTSVPVGSTAALSDPAIVMPTFLADLAGNYVVQLIVNDGQLASAPVTVTVTTGNSPPVADPGPDQSVFVDATVQLDGSGSSDPDMDVLGFAWSFTSMPTGSMAALSSSTASNPTFVADEAGIYVVQLIVDDGMLSSQPVTMMVTAQGGDIALALLETSVVGVGRSADVSVTLSSPAPAGGATVTLSSDDPSVLAVAAPGSVTIPQGMTMGVATVDGVAAGSTILRGMSPGFAAAALPVDVTLNLLSVPATLTAPLGQSVSIPITLSPNPAPAGGLMVTLTSSDPTRVQVMTPTVFIPAGSFGANGTLVGGLPGPAEILATSPSFASDQADVTTTAELNIVESSLTISAGLPGQITVGLQSGGSPIAAPAPGVTVTLTASDPGCIGVPMTITIPSGLTTATAAVAYGGLSALPCTGQVAASAGAGVTGDSVDVDVDPAPGISLFGFATNLGSGLQGTSYSAALQDGNHGGVTVHVESADPTSLLVAPNGSSAGAASIDVFLPNGSTNVPFTLGSIAGASGAASVTVSAPGFMDGTASVQIVQPGVAFVSLASSIDTVDPDDVFILRVGIPNAGGTTLSTLQAARVGGGPLTATATSSDPAVGEMLTLAGNAGSATVEIPAGAFQSESTVATGGIAFRPLSPGMTTVAVSLPGFVSTDQASQVVEVTGPTMTLSAIGDIPGGLQRSGLTATLSASQHGGVTLRIESSDPTRALVAPNASTPGTAFIDLAVPDGQVNVAYVVQGIAGAGGSAVINASAPGFDSASQSVDLVQPGVQILSLATSIDTLDADDDFILRVGLPNAAGTALAQVLPVRTGGGVVTATVMSSTPAFGEVVTSSQSGASASVVISEGQFQSGTSVAMGGVAFRPLTPGQTTVSAAIPGFLSTTQASVDVTVVGPTMNLVGISPTPAGLARTTASVGLSAAQHGGITVRIESSNPGLVLVAPDSSTAGTAFIDRFVANGQSNVSFTVQSLAGTTGAATITASATGFSSASGPVDVVQAGLQIISLATTIDTLDPDDDFIARVGLPNAAGTALQQLLPVRVGGGDLSFAVGNSVPGVGELVTLTSTGQTVAATIVEGNFQSAASLALGGVAFRSLSTGMTTVSASSPGLLSTAAASVDITVTAPSISVATGTNVGAGLSQTAASFTLSASQHGGVTVRVESTNPGVALVAPNSTTPGTAFIDVVIPNGQTTTSFVVQGMEGATGSPVIQAMAPGFTDGSGVINVVQPGLQIVGLNNPTTTSAAPDSFLVRTGVPNAQGTALAQLQPIRAGRAALMVTVSSSNPSVGVLTTSAGSAGSRVVAVDEGSFQSGPSVAAGGVEFSVLTAGMTNVSASASGFLTTGAADVQVTVNP